MRSLSSLRSAIVRLPFVLAAGALLLRPGTVHGQSRADTVAVARTLGRALGEWVDPRFRAVGADSLGADSLGVVTLVRPLLCADTSAPRCDLGGVPPRPATDPAFSQAVAAAIPAYLPCQVADSTGPTGGDPPLGRPRVGANGEYYILATSEPVFAGDTVRVRVSRSYSLLEPGFGQFLEYRYTFVRRLGAWQALPHTLLYRQMVRVAGEP